MIWIALLLLALAAMVPLVAMLFRPVVTRGRREADLALYRAQLAELDREAAAGRLEGDALRAALSLLAMPWNAPIAARSLARSVNAIWYAAGDKSADFSWYTRRATLAAIYSATLAFWLSGRGDGLEAALEFLDRRLADHASFQKGLARFKPRAA